LILNLPGTKLSEQDNLPLITDLPADWKPPSYCLKTTEKEYSTAWDRIERVSSVEWFEKNIKLSKRISAFPGYYSRYNFPFQVGFLELFDDMDSKEISMQWGTQLGKTTLFAAIPSKVASTDPSPMLFVCTDENQAREVSDEKIMATAEEVPGLKEKLLPKARRDKLKPDFGDCVVYMGWSGSTSTLGGRPCRYVIGTELSKWNRQKSEEADPGDLVRERVKGFWDSKMIFEGTPTVKGICRMEALEKSANQSLKFKVPCPHCDHHQVLTFRQLKFKTKPKFTRDLAEKSAYYQCIKCKKKIEDHHKMPIMRRGIWAEYETKIPKSFINQPVETRGTIYYTPGKEKKRIHIQLGSLYSPILTFGDVASEFVRSKLSGSLQNFFNGWAAETWTHRQKEYEWQSLKKKLQVQVLHGGAPEWAVFLTAGADVQARVCYFTIRAWGYGGRSRLVVWGQSPSIKIIEDYCLKTSYKKAGTQIKLPVSLLGVDSGYNSYKVYLWVNQMREKYGDQVRPIKGQPAARGIYWASDIERSGEDGKVIPGGIQLWNINDHHWKSFVVQKFDIPATFPGAWEVTSDADEMYMRGITSEVLVETKNKWGQKAFVWEIVDPEVGNHYLDCEKIDACMWHMLGGETLEDPTGGNEEPPYDPSEEETGEGDVFGGGFLGGAESMGGPGPDFLN